MDINVCLKNAMLQVLKNLRIKVNNLFNKYLFTLLNNI